MPPRNRPAARATPTPTAAGNRPRPRAARRFRAGWTPLLFALVFGWAGDAAGQSRTITIDSPTVAEGNPVVPDPDKPDQVEATVDLVFTLTLSSASPEGKETVRYQDAGTGTATAEKDYLEIETGTDANKDANYAVAGWSASETTTTITVTVRSDELDEANETIVLNFSDPNDATLAATTATGTITDDDPTPAVTLTLGNSSIAESGSTASTNVTAGLDSRSSVDTTVTVAAAAGTNADSADFSLSATKVLTIAAGQTTSTGTVTIAAVDNALDEEDKSVTVSGTASNTVGITQPANVTLTITDDDPEPSLSISSPSVTEGDSGSADLTFTVTLDAASGKEVTVEYADAGTGTATSGTDYTAIAAGTLTFAPGETTKDLIVAVAGDTDSETDETVAVRLGNPMHATIATSLGAGTIRDQDGPPTVTLALSAAEIPESGANNSATVTASLNRASTAVTTITVSATPGANADASNFSLTGSELTIAAGDLASTGAVTIAAVDDADDELDRKVVVSGVAANSDPEGVSGPASLTLTIVDDDGLPGLYVDSPEVAEGDSGSTAMDFTVTVSPAPSAAVSVDYADAGTGAATSGTDYTALTAGSLGFAAAETTKTITVSVLGDALDETDETVVLALSNASGATLGASTATGTIRDDDTSSSLSISSETVTEGTGPATDLTFTVSLSAVSARQVTVNYADAGTGTAASGQDYTAIPAGTLTFAPGDTTKTFTVSVTGDALDETAETVAVTLSGARGARIATATASGTITDDDDPPSLSLDSPTIAEGDGGSTNLDFTVSLSAVSGQEVTVDYAEGSGGTATSGADYTAITAGTLTIAAGRARGTIRVVVTGDRTDEGNETIVLGLSSPGNATIATATGTGTVTDDDGAPRVTLALQRYSITESGDSLVTAGLTHPSTEATTVTVAFAAGANTQTTHFATTGTTLTIAAGATASTGTVQVRGVDDTADNSNRSVVVSGTATNSRGVVNPESVTLTIVDDDGLPKLTIDSPRVTEGDSGRTNLNFTVTLSPVSSSIVSASFSENGSGTATRGTDFDRLSPGSVTFAPNTPTQQITVSVRGDTAIEANETVVVQLRFPSGATFENAIGTGTIVDDEDQPTLSIDSPTVTEGDSGSTNLDFTVTLSAASPNSVHVDFGVAGGTAIERGSGSTNPRTDFQLGDGSLNFAAGETTKTIRATVSGDTKDEPDETVVVTLRNPISAILADGRGVGTITDDDAPPTIGIGSPSVAEGDTGSTNLTFPVSLSAASGRTVTVRYEDEGSGTATSGTDYAALAAGSLTFAENETTNEVVVAVLGDELDEPHETVKVQLEGPSNATLATALGEGTITDDDPTPSLSIDSPTVPEGDSGSADLTFTVTLSAASGREVTVDYEDTGDGTATSATDYAALTAGTLTFAAGETSQTVTVSVTGDLDHERDETVEIELSDPANATLATATGTGTITDDETVPAVTLALSAAEIPENGGSATVTATLDASSSAETVITVSAAGGADTDHTDFTLGSARTLTIAAGDTASTGTVTISAEDDAADEANKIVRVTGAAANSVGVTDPPEVLLTIVDDDGQSGVYLDSPSVTEGDSGQTTLTFTVSVSPASAAQVTVDYADAGTGTATAGTDYSSLAGGTLTFAANETSRTVAVTVLGDTLSEDDETVRLTLGNPTGASVGVAAGVGTILDDDDPPTVSLGATSAAEGDVGSTNLTWTATLSAAAGRTITVAYADTGEGTATAGTDYAAVSGTLTFLPGATSATFGAPIFGDRRDEPNETVVMGLSDARGATIATANGTGTINDDDGQPTLAIDSPSVNEGDSGSTDLTFTVTLSAASDREVTVGYSDPGSGTATSGTDYAAITAGTLTFAAGETTRTITVSVTGDTTDEPNETVRVLLASARNAAIVSGTGTGTILDDEDSPSVTLLLGSAAITEGGSTRVTAALSRASTAATSITVSVSPATAASLGSNATLTIAAGSTTSTGIVEITGASDTTDNANRTVTVSGSATNTRGVTNPANVTLTVIDDDGSPKFTIDSPRILEGDSGARTLVYTVRLSPVSSQQTVVNFSETGAGTATRGTDFVRPTPGGLVFAPNTPTKTVQVTISGDTTDEPNETVVVQLSSPQNATIETGTGTGTIVDDDATPKVSLALSRNRVGESGATNSTTVTATLDRASAQATTITVSAAPGTNADASDFTLSAGPTLTIAAGSTTSSGTVTVTAAADALDEPDQQVTISATAQNAMGVVAPAPVSLTITDDDAPPSLSLAATAVSEGDSGSRNLTWTVTLDAASGKQILVDYSDAGSGTATSGTDYTALAAGTLTFAPGDRAGTFTVAVTGDTTDEPDETITVRLTNARNAGIAVGTESGTIRDDDAQPAAALVLTPASIAESGTMNASTVTATLDRPSSEDTTITVSATAGANAAAGDFRLSANRDLTIAAGNTASTGTVTITAVDNTTDDADKSVSVTGAAVNSLGVTAPAAKTLTITDDDASPSLSIDSPSAVTEGDSGTVALTFTVTLSAASTQSVTVDYADAGTGSATGGTDYEALSSGTLTFAAGDTSGQITVTVNGDTTDEPNETVAVALSNPMRATIATATGTGTITDDDDAPTVTLSLSRSSITESGTNNATTVTAGLDHPSSAATTITVSAAAGTNAVAADFSLSSTRTLTIAAGDTSSTGTVTVTANDNTEDEPDKTVTVSGNATNGQGIAGPADVDLTITDDDPEPSLSIGAASATEGDSGTANLTFTVSLGAASGKQVTVEYTDAGTGSATSGTDYTALSDGTLTFAAGTTSRTITVSVTGDTDDEGHETVRITLRNATNASIATATGTGTITDDDGPPTVSLVLTPGSIAESGASNSSTVTATLSHASIAATTVTVAAAAGTNAVAADFGITANRTLTIAAGDTTSTGTVTITAVDNTTDEPDKSVTVSGTAVNTQGVTNPADRTLTITDDDAPPTLSVDSPSVNEGDSGSANLTFTVSLDAASGKQITVGWADAGSGSATSGTDYTALAGGTLTFAVGALSQTITVAVTGDTTDEPNETVAVALSGALNAAISATAGTGTGTITDDDAAPTVTLALSRGSVTESGTNNSTTVTASLDHPSSAATTITVAAAAGTNAVSGDFSLSANKVLTIAAGGTTSTGTVTITAVDNSTDEDDKSVTVSGTATNSQGITQPSDRTLTITDDDGPPSLSLDSPSVDEGDSGTANLTFTVTLSAASDKQVTVNYAEGSGGTATAGTDYTALTGGTLTFAAGDLSEQFTVSVTGDTTDEPNETVVVTLAGAMNATIGAMSGTGTGTITDDDAAPTVTLALSPDSIAESGASNASTVTASLDHPSSEATSITVSATAGTNAEAGDFALGSNAVLTIAAGDTTSTGTVTITAVDDTTDEEDKSVTVSGSATNSQGITQPSNRTLTITDDDAAPTLSIEAPSAVSEGDSGSTNLTFTVRLSAASGKQVTVDYGDAGSGTATSGTDYTAITTTKLTFAAGDTSRTFTVSVTGDTTDEPDETVAVELSGAMNAGISATAGAGTGTITDDDDAPTVTLTLTPPSIAESGTGNRSTVTATLDHPSSEDTAITVAAAAGTGAEAADFSLSANKALTIAAGDTTSTGAVTVTAVDNSTDEADKSVTVSATATNSQGITNPDDATLTITDDDAPASLSIAGPSAVTEGDSGSASLTFTVTLSPASGKEVTVEYADSGDGTATSGTDYTALTGGTLTFAAGDTSKTVTVSVTGDATDEPDETIEVELGNAGNAVLGTATGTGTITDDDDAPKVTLSLSPDSIAESGSSNESTVTATLDRPSSEDTTITVAAAAGTNAVTADFSLSSNPVLTVSAGDTSSTGTVTITANDNTADEDDKSVTVSGSATNSQGITDPDDATLTITDDDLPPSLAVDSPSVTEGDSGSVNLTWTVTLSAASDKTVEVEYAEGGGSAAAGADYTALADGTLTFNAGDLSETVTVPVNGDTTDEPNETVVVTLRNPTNATIGAATGTGQITDDDGEPSLAIASAMVAEGDSGTTNLAYTVTLTPASGKQVTVQYADAGSGTATGGTDYTALAGGTLTFAVGDTSKTVTVPVRGDRSDEPNETVVVELSGARNATIGTASGTGTITDDDGEPALAIDSPSAPEGTGTPGTLTFTVTVSPVSGKEVTVGYADTGTGTATAGDDYTAPAAGTLTFAPGTASRTIPVALLADGDIEPAETVVLQLSGPTNATIGTGTGAGRITDDDTPTPSGGGGGEEETETPRLSIDSPTVTESDSGSVSLVYTVSLNPAASSRVSVSYSVTSGTAAAGADFTVLQAGTLVFRAGETSKTIEVTVLPDDAPEEDETIVVQLSDARGAGIATGTGIGTIRDDDRPDDEADLRFVSSITPRTWREDTPIRPLLLPEASGGTAPLTYALSPAPPPGLTLDLPRRTLSGTPAAPFARREYRWTATDAADRSATLTFTITVRPDLKPSFPVAAGPDLRYRVGRARPPETLPAAEGGDGALTYALTPALPPGLSFAPATRTLSGTPTAARGRAGYTLTATDEDGDAAALPFAITVRAATTLDLLRIVSRPANGDTYFHGEAIEVEAVFSDPVTVPGAAALALTVGDRTRAAPLAGTNGATLRFRYRVQATDRDLDGVSVAANALTLGVPGGPAGPLGIDASHPPLPDRPGHRVDGAPQAVGTLPALTLTLGGAPARVEIGEAFHAAFRHAVRSSAPEVATVALAEEAAAPAVLVTAVAEGRASITVTGSNAGGAAEQQFEVTVVTARAEREVVEHALAGLGRSLLSSASSVVGRRLRSGGGGRSVASPPGAGGEGKEDEDGHEVTFTGLPTDDRLRLEESLRTARSFSLSARRPGGPRWTVWASGDLQSFSGETPSGEANTFTGRPLTSWLGVDVAGGGVLAGLSVARTAGDADYAFADPAAEVSGTGRLETELFQVHPYFRWSPGPRTTVWGHGGFGRGSATLTRSVSPAAEEANLNLMVGLAGLRRALGTAGGASLALRADLGGSRVAAADGALLRDLAATVYRGRLGLEVATRLGPATPFLEFGGRYDGGAGPTGAGLEVAGGLRVNDERGRLGLEARGRVLALHTASGYREQGISLTARFTPKGGDRGLLMEVRPTWGAPANGAHTFWQDGGGGLDELGAAAGNEGGAMAARVSYGLGLLTPFTEVTWTDALSRMIRAGLRVGRYGRSIDVELAGGRRQRPDGGADYRFDLYGRLRLP